MGLGLLNRKEVAAGRTSDLRGLSCSESKMGIAHLVRDGFANVLMGIAHLVRDGFANVLVGIAHPTSLRLNQKSREAVKTASRL